MESENYLHIKNGRDGRLIEIMETSLPISSPLKTEKEDQ